MAEEYKNINFYAGADYGLDSNKGYGFLGFPQGDRYSASTFGFPTDPRIANQLKAVSDKFSTGAKTIEVSGVTPAELESIPKQHFKEINRLKKLVGADLTFHGPLVEPTGVTKQGWNESDREQAERQMWSAVERSHDLEPKGNIVVTFHSSNGLPEPESIVLNPKTKKEEITDFWVVDERTGQFQAMQPKTSYFKSEDKQKYESIESQGEKIKDSIKEQNKDVWVRTLQGVSYHANQGAHIVSEALSSQKIKEIKEKIASEEDLLKAYKEFLSTGNEEKLKRFGPYADAVKSQFYDITHGDLYLRDAYQQLQSLFNQAYDSAKRANNKDNLEKLDKYREEIKPYLSEIENPEKLPEFADEIVKGVNVLRSIATPQTLRPLRDFAVDKASETFSNLALQAYKKFGDTAPIISIENPPAGSGLNRGEDLRQLIEATREKFVEKAKSDGLSEHEAKEQAEKLIGVTWDVGHINMVRKFGYGDKELIKETEKVSPYVKHIHLSDNFGMEHTELPMGMGNVPMKEHLAKLKEQYGDKLKKIKQIVETGTWFRDFKITPFRETLQAFGSPVGGMEMSPYWNQVAHSSGGYSTGFGNYLPPVHFGMYGSGFSNLPVELGGQSSGRNRLSGAPME